MPSNESKGKAIYTSYQIKKNFSFEKLAPPHKAECFLRMWEPVRDSTVHSCFFLSFLVVGYYRDIKDTTVGTLSQRITNQVHGLKGLNSKLLDIRSYLEKVATGKLPINHQIIYQLQDVFNLLPDVSLQEFVKAFYLKTNDQMVVVYLASLIRSVVALHNLINNKIANRDAEKKEGQEKEESKKDRKDDKEKEKDKEKSDVKKEEKKEKKWNM